MSLALAGATLGAPSHAQPSLALGVDVAPPGDAGFVVSSPDARGHGSLRARLVADYASEPLVLIGASDRAYRVVERQLRLHGALSLALFHRVLIYVDLPVAVATQGEGAAEQRLVMSQPREGLALADSRLGARVRVLGPAGDGVQLALQLEGRAPTGAAEAYASDGGLGGKALVSIGLRSRVIVFSADGGVRFRESERIGGVLPTRVGTALTAGTLAQLPLDRSRRYWLGPEISASLGVGEGARLLDPRSTLVQLLVGGRARPLSVPLEVNAGFGPGLGRAAGSPDYRVLFGLAWVPEVAAPPPDRDGDGVPDTTDICLRLAGAPSRDPLMHGCPEVPVDTDADAVPDAYDACPKQPGIPTAARRTHGCPKLAPVPSPAPTAKLSDRSIEISEQVQFETGTAVLVPDSARVLAAVARVLLDDPSLALVEVAGHTDGTGTPESNVALSTERARAVLEWLVAHGVARSRLMAVGHGESLPLSDNATEAGKARNRRVEFRVLQRVPPAGGVP